MAIWPLPVQPSSSPAPGAAQVALLSPSVPVAQHLGLAVVARASVLLRREVKNQRDDDQSICLLFKAAEMGNLAG